VNEKTITGPSQLIIVPIDLVAIFNASSGFVWLLWYGQWW
jgi:hypothetical protein